MDLPTVQQLKYLVSLADNSSFHAAAASCFVSQSTLSTGIKNLENQLGVLLVDRSNRVLVFTEVGTEVVTIARRILEQAGDIVRTAKSGGQPLTGELKVGGIPTIMPYVVGELIRRTTSEYPELSMSLTEMNTNQLLERLLQGRLDVLLLALPYQLVRRENLSTLSLFQDTFHLSYHRSMAGILAGKVQRLDELPSEKLLLMSEGHCLRGHTLDLCSLRKNFRAVSTFEVNSLQTLKSLVQSGTGYTFFPEVALNGGLLAGTDILTEPTEATRTISLVWRKSSGRDEEMAAFGELFSGFRQATETPVLAKS